MVLMSTCPKLDCCEDEWQSAVTVNLGQLDKITSCK